VNAAERLASQFVGVVLPLPIDALAIGPEVAREPLVLRSTHISCPDRLRVRTYPLDGSRWFRDDGSMRGEPDIASVAALIGDPARAAMLTALADGRCLPAGELAAV